MATDGTCRLGATSPISTLALTQLLGAGRGFPQPGTGAAPSTMAIVARSPARFAAFGASPRDGAAAAGHERPGAVLDPRHGLWR